MRFLIFALACLVAPVAHAQSTVATPEATRAVRALSQIWRPLTETASQASIQAACRGAEAEMEAVDAALPPVLTPESLARVHALRSLLVVPNSATEATAFFFPSRDLTWLASGVGVIRVINEGEGFLAIQDAEGHDIALQLGSAGGHPMLRIRPPGTTSFLTFVGCATTAAQ